MASLPRLKKFRAMMKQGELAAVLLSHSPNISYLTEYSSRDSLLLITQARAFYFTDSRYALEAREHLPSSVRIELVSGDLPGVLRRTLKTLRIKQVGFESRYVSCAFYKKLISGCKGRTRFCPAPELVEQLRQVKEEKELTAIRKAVSITAGAYTQIKPLLKPGVTELEVAGELQCIIRRLGAQDASFAIIVASGPNAAFPHHLCSRRKLRSGDPVIIDMGVVVNGYRSDLTRTFFLGKINSLIQRVYATVRRAQEEVFRLISPGVKVSDLDAAARAVIVKAGYGRYFGHNLGHGVGIEVHEAPYLSGNSATVIKPGMLFTIEPGIYLPRKFGIRIEDMVLVTKKGNEVISGFIDK